MILLILTTVLPLFAMAGVKRYLDYRDRLNATGLMTLEVARGTAQAVEGELRIDLARLQVLAMTGALRRGDVDALLPRIDGFLSLYPDANLAILDPSGHVLGAFGPDTSNPFPGNIGTLNNGQQRVLSTGLPVVTDLYADAVTHRLQYDIDVPVKQDGQVAYILGLSRPATVMVALLAAQHFPSTWTVSMFDGAGTDIARFPIPEGVVNDRTLEQLHPRLMTAQDGVFDNTALDGTSMQTAFSHSHMFGWSVAIGVPKTALLAALWWSLTETAGIAAVAALLSGGAAYALSRRVLDPMQALLQWAASPQLAPLPPTLGLREADDLAVNLQRVAQQRQAATDELRTLADTLEARVRQEVAAREATQMQLVGAQRMEALGKLAGGIAHDFNNVLQAIGGALELIQYRIDNIPTVRRNALHASEAVKRGSAITSRLLTFARSGSLQAEPVSPRLLLENLGDMLAPTLGPNIAIKVKANPDLPPLMADRGQLETVLVNLSLNGRDAMPSGGTLTLSADRDTAGESLDRPPSLDAGTWIRLDVTDTGTGMDPATLARATEPFFTTKPFGKGTGLGLAMARGFAEQSGGRLGIQSEPGRGTTVSLWVPQAHPGSVRAEPIDTATTGNGTFAGSVLLVDDDVMVRASLSGQLEALGYTVSLASDGVAALAHLETEGAPDLLISDFAMPGMNGLALLDAARCIHPRLPAILLTEYADASLPPASTQQYQNTTRLLRKPARGDELARAVAILLSRSDDCWPS